MVAGGLLGALLLAVITCYFLIPRTAQPSPIAEKLARYALSDIFDGADVKLENVTLARGNLREPISLRASAIRLYPAGTPSTLETPAQAAFESENFIMNVSPLALITGQAAIDAITIENVKLVAQRDEKGRYRFGLANPNKPAKAAPRAPVRPFAVLDRINNLHIDNASFVLEDLATRQSETIANLSINLRKDAAFGQSLITATARESKDSVVPSLDFVLTTTKTEKDAEIIMYLNKLDMARLTPFVPAWNKRIAVAEGAFTGEIRLHYNKGKETITNYKVELDATQGRFQLADIMLRPIVYDAINIAFTEKGLSILGTVEGSGFNVQAGLRDNAAGGYDIVADIPSLDLKQIDGIWKPGRESVAQEWVTEKLKNGRIKNVHVKGFWHKDVAGKWTMSDLAADFAVEDMWVLYKHDLAPAENLFATGHYENDKLSLKMERGTVSGMNILEGELHFADLTVAGKGDCKGLLRLSGSLQSVLSYLDNPIIRYKERVALDLSKASGNVTMSLGLDFPTTKTAKTEHIKVDVDAVMRNANLPDVVSGITLTGGPLALKGSPDKILLRGDVRLNEAPSFLTYETYFSKENAPFVQKLDLKGNLTQATLEEFGMADWVRGMQSSSRYAVSYEQPLQGVAAVKASLSGPSLSVQNATIALNNKNAFVSAKLDGLVMGASKGDMNITRNKVGGYNIGFTGSTFDARPVLKSSPKKKKEKSPANLSASVSATKLITSDNGALDGVKIAYASNKNGDTSKLSLTGKAGGKPVTINFNEGARGDTLRVDILDAGAFLKIMDVADGVKGGEINIEASPNGAYGSMKGRARIRNFTARDIPLLGRLINALSLPGLFQLFTSQGIYFDRLRTDFTWEKTKGDSILRLKNGASRGSSLGLTFEGSYNQTRKSLDMKGKVVPLSEINNIVKSIPLLGPLISGGRNGALVAANYTMKGSPDDPRVFINPLSILTPGLLRTILFENDTEAPAN